MPDKTAPKNTFCWDELATSDVAAAKSFYGRLFGWNANDVSMGPMPYTFAQLHDTAVVGLMALGPQHAAMNVPPHWLSWVAVEDADKSAARAKELGGRVLAGPMDYGDMGRGAIVAEPTGAAFALGQPQGAQQPRVVGEPGSVGWNELLSTNVDASATFLTKLLGWKASIDTMGHFQYTTFTAGGERVAGMLPMPKEAGPAPSHWLAYFVADSVDRSVARAKELGGKVLVPAFEVQGVGRFATLQDPQGAVFALAQMGA